MVVVEYTDIYRMPIHFYIDGTLSKKLETNVKASIGQKDDDVVFIVDGAERGGKSVLSMQVAKFLDPSFTLDRVCMTPQEFYEAIANAEKGQAIIYDEAFTGLSARRALTEINHMLVSTMMECQPAGNKVLMANGEWKNIEDIKIGDEVLSPQENGDYIYSKVIKLRKFNNAFTYDIIELKKQKKKLYSCSFSHKLPIKMKRKKFRLISAEEFSKFTKKTKECYPSLTAFPIKQFKNRKNCEIEPYTLGVFIGNGDFGDCCRITSNFIEPINEITKYYPFNYIEKRNFTTCLRYSFSLKGDLAKKLEKYGLRNKTAKDKFIPKEALLSDIEYRKRLLAGLIDSDGYKTKRNGYILDSASKKLVEDVYSLVHSLGGRADIYSFKKKTPKSKILKRYWRVTFNLSLDLPVLIPHRQKTDKKFLKGNKNQINLDSVPSKKKDIYGITLDSLSGLYITDNWMVTHNCGQKNLIIFIVLPTFFMLDKYVALFRARGLFHVYRKGTQKGFWAYFNSDRKKQLYLKGQKFMNYSGAKANFRGRFYNQYVIDEARYRLKKRKALENKALDKQEARYIDQRNRFIYMVWREWVKSKRDIEDLCEIYGINLKAKQISTIIQNLYEEVEPYSVTKKREKLEKMKIKEEIQKKLRKHQKMMKEKLKNDLGDISKDNEEGEDFENLEISGQNEPLKGGRGPEAGFEGGV